MPTPTHAAATHSAHGSGIAASSARPTPSIVKRVVTDSARPEPLGEPAPPTRSTRHTALYTANSPPEPDSRATGRGRGGTPRTRRTRPCRRRARCLGRPRRDAASARRRRGARSAGDSGRRERRDVGAARRSTRGRQRRRTARRGRTRCGTRTCSSIASPTIGPMPMPPYTATEKYDAASARRSGGLRSAISVIAATNSAASPAPVSAAQHEQERAASRRSRTPNRRRRRAARRRSSRRDGRSGSTSWPISGRTAIATPANDGDRQADAQLSAAQLVLDVRGHERHEHADVHEERERRRRHGEERPSRRRCIEASDALEPSRPGASRRRRPVESLRHAGGPMTTRRGPARRRRSRVPTPP